MYMCKYNVYVYNLYIYIYIYMSIHTCIYTRGTRTLVAPAPVRAHTHTCTGRRTATPANLGSSVSRWCSFKEHCLRSTRLK